MFNEKSIHFFQRLKIEFIFILAIVKESVFGTIIKHQPAIIP